jgi:hypothetical protein
LGKGRSNFKCVMVLNFHSILQKEMMQNLRIISGGRISGTGISERGWFFER